jgi:nuclear pore complex protein Nup188
LKEYEHWLRTGVAGFKPPNPSSKRSIDTDPHLTVSGKKLPIDPKLKKATHQMSSVLSLDEVQTHILLRRWLAASSTKPQPYNNNHVSPSLHQHQRGDDYLNQSQAFAVARMYYEERLRLLKAIEKLLWLGEGVAGDGAFLDSVESTLAALLSGGEADNLEQATVDALTLNLTRGGGAVSSNSHDGTPDGDGDALALVSSLSNLGPPPLSYSSLSPDRLRSSHLILERCTLLNILMLVYYHPRRACTAERFLELAELFHSHLFFDSDSLIPPDTYANDTAGGSTVSEVAAREGVARRLGALLLLEALTIDVPINLIAEGRSLAPGNNNSGSDGTSGYGFADPSTYQKVDAMMRRWTEGPGAVVTASHAPVVLAWSATRCLMERVTMSSSLALSSSSRGGGWQQLALKAHEIGALRALHRLSNRDVLQPHMGPFTGEMASNVLLGAASAILAAFDLSPLRLPLSDTTILATTLANIFKDIPALCEGLWAADRPLEKPIYVFLDECRALFPAFPIPIYTMLAALSATEDSAASANAFLAHLPWGLTCLHSLDEGGLVEDVNHEGKIHSHHALSLPGATALTLPEGTVGEALALPGTATTIQTTTGGNNNNNNNNNNNEMNEEGYNNHNNDGNDDGTVSSSLVSSLLDRVWTLPPNCDADAIRLVNWRLPLADGIGQWILLCRSFECLKTLVHGFNNSASSNGGGYSDVQQAALEELSAGLALLKAVCERDPATAMELLHVEVPVVGLDDGPTSNGYQQQFRDGAMPSPSTRGPDILSLALQAVKTLVSLPHPPIDTIGHCFIICSSLAQGIPGRVAAELLTVLGLRSFTISSIHNTATTASAYDALSSSAPSIPMLNKLIKAEGVVGRYNGSISFLKLLLALCSAAEPSEALGPILQYVLFNILGQHKRWRYAVKADRWKLACTALRVVRQALLSTNALSLALTATLQYDAGVATCLFPALPPDAFTLEKAALGAGGSTMDGNGMMSGWYDEDSAVAVEDCCREWLRLLPVLLPTFSTTSNSYQEEDGDKNTTTAISAIAVQYHNHQHRQQQLSPAAFFHQPSDDTPSPAAVLISYLGYPLFRSAERGLVIRGVHCLAVAAAQSAPHISFAALFSSHTIQPGIFVTISSGGENDAMMRAKRCMAAALHITSAAAAPQLFFAACDVLIVALQYHPSLADVLMFPCRLTHPAALNTTNGVNEEVGIEDGHKMRNKNINKDGNAKEEYSCLDTLWELLQRADTLRQDHPKVLSKSLKVLSTMWQTGSVASRPLVLLQSQPQFWSHLIGGLLQHAVDSPLSSFAPSTTSSSMHQLEAAAWAGKDDTAALLAAEGYALQILAIEATSWASQQQQQQQQQQQLSEELVAAIKVVTRGSSQAKLLSRYCSVLPTSPVLNHLERQAAIAGLQLLGVAMVDDVMWASMSEGEGLVPHLFAATAPLLTSLFSSKVEAATVLSANPASVLENVPLLLTAAAPKGERIGNGYNNEEVSRVKLHLASLMLVQGEVSEQLAAGRDYGKSYVYDSATLFSRRVGAVLLRNLDELQALSSWMDAASVVASLEDARLGAATAYRVLTLAVQKAFVEDKRGSRASVQQDDGSGSGSSKFGRIAQEDITSCLKMLDNAMHSIISQHTVDAMVAEWDGLAPLPLSSSSSSSSSSLSSSSVVAIDLVNVHMAGLSEASLALLVLLQRWFSSHTSSSAGNNNNSNSNKIISSVSAVSSMVLGVLNTWLTQSSTLQQYYNYYYYYYYYSSNNNSDGSMNSGANNNDNISCSFYDGVTSNLLAGSVAAVSHLSSLISAGAAGFDLKDGVSGELIGAAEAVMPSLLTICGQTRDSSSSKHVVTAASLAIALADVALVPSTWLPMISSHINLADRLAVAAAHLPSRGLVTPQSSSSSTSSLSLSSHGAASVEEALLLLALQVAQVPQGAAMLAEQGIARHLIRLLKWLFAAEGGDLLLEERPGKATMMIVDGGTGSLSSQPPPPPTTTTTMVDYSRAYSQDGTASPAHKLWCATLALLGILLSSLPGNRSIEEASLQLVILAQDRLLLAINPPEASPGQPLTLAMCQEAKYTLFFICGLLTRLAGEWRYALPESIPLMRQATATLISFVAAAMPGAACVAVTAAEKSRAGVGMMKKMMGEGSLEEGWFGVCRGGGVEGGGGHQLSLFHFQLASELYSCAQYALIFQLAVAPELGEEEAEGGGRELGPEWPVPAALSRLAEQAAALIMVKPDVKLVGCLASILNNATKMLRMRGVVNAGRVELLVEDALQKMKRGG